MSSPARAALVSPTPSPSRRRSTSPRSTVSPPRPTPMRSPELTREVFPLVQPRRDALDDEEPLPRTDEPEPTRLALQRLGRVRVREPVLQLALLRLERANVGRTLGELVLGV